MKSSRISSKAFSAQFSCTPSPLVLNSSQSTHTRVPEVVETLDLLLAKCKGNSEMSTIFANDADYAHDRKGLAGHRHRHRGAGDVIYFIAGIVVAVNADAIRSIIAG
jgi:hypothetical protein